MKFAQIASTTSPGKIKGQVADVPNIFLPSLVADITDPNFFGAELCQRQALRLVDLCLLDVINVKRDLISVKRDLEPSRRPLPARCAQKTVYIYI
jgi:hypothetical protein